MDDEDQDFTWRVLRDKIDAMPEDRLDDVVQFIPPPAYDDDEPRPLGAVIGMNSIGYYSTGVEDGLPIENHTRGSIDNKHHVEHYVLLTDVNPFSKEGDRWYEMTDDGFIGNATGKNYGMGLFAESEAANDITELIRKMTPSEFRESLIRAGIIDENGELTSPYKQ